MFKNLNRVQKVSLILVVIFLISIPILYLLSDSRIEILREIYRESDIYLPKGTEYLGDISKDPSFFGDGIALRLVRLKEEDEKSTLKALEERMDRVEINSEEFSNMESAYLRRSSGNYEIESMNIYSKDCVFYYKSLRADGGNFVGVVYDRMKNKFLLIVMDT